MCNLKWDALAASHFLLVRLALLALILTGCILRSVILVCPFPHASPQACGKGSALYVLVISIPHPD